jgi:hypothetical protein
MPRELRARPTKPNPPIRSMGGLWASSERPPGMEDAAGRTRSEAGARTRAIRASETSSTDVSGSSGPPARSFSRTTTPAFQWLGSRPSPALEPELLQNASGTRRGLRRGVRGVPLRTLTRTANAITAGRGPVALSGSLPHRDARPHRPRSDRQRLVFVGFPDRLPKRPRSSLPTTHRSPKSSGPPEAPAPRC